VLVLVLVVAICVFGICWLPVVIVAVAGQQAKRRTERGEAKEKEVGSACLLVCACAVVRGATMSALCGIIS